MKKTVLLFFVSFSFLEQNFAQSSNDLGLWTTLNIEKKIKKDVVILFTEEYRRKENFTRTNLFYTDIGVEVHPLKFLKISLAYRMIEKYLIENTFSYRHRLMLNITLKHKFGDFSFSYRQRLQSEVRDVYSSESGSMPEWYSRNKIELKYDLNKLVQPYIGAEYRYQFIDPRNVESNNYWHRQRYFIGLDYKKDDKNTFGIYYLIQNEFNVSSPNNICIIGLEYSLSL